jgi:hypothetical protein
MTLYWTSAQGLAALVPAQEPTDDKAAPGRRVKGARYRKR